MVRFINLGEGFTADSGQEVPEGTSYWETKDDVPEVYARSYDHFMSVDLDMLKPYELPQSMLTFVLTSVLSERLVKTVRREFIILQKLPCTNSEGENRVRLVWFTRGIKEPLVL